MWALYYRMRYTLRFLRFHMVHQRSVRTIRAWQEKQLRKVLPYLATNIPLYKELLARHRVDTAHILHIADLPKLPIMNKTMFLGRYYEDFTDNSTLLSGQWDSTSGSSGTPFSPFRKSHVTAQYYRDSLHFRFLLARTPWRFDTEWMRMVQLRVIPRERPNRLYIRFDDFLRDPKTAIDQMVAFEPHAIETVASLLPEVARSVERFKSPLRFKYAISMGEKMTPLARAHVERILHCEVFDRYGLEEFGNVGSECSAHDGFHINVESFIVEVVDTDGMPLSDGTYGKVLITDVFNYQMPFVRYDTGDRGRLSWEKCTCGLYAQRLWIDGRYSSMLSFGDRRFHQFEFDVKLQPFMNIVHRYQIVKKAEDRMLVRIVPSARFDERTESQLVETLMPLVGPKIALTVEAVSNIERYSKRGKTLVLSDESTTS